MEHEQLERFEQAVEEKKEESRRRSEATAPVGGDGDSAVGGDQPTLTERGRPQDVRDERKKNSGHGKKTADKWNQ